MKNSVRLIFAFIYISSPSTWEVPLLNVPILIAKAVEACVKSRSANQKPYERPKQMTFAAGKYFPGTLTPWPYNYYPVSQPLVGVPCVLITA